MSLEKTKKIKKNQIKNKKKFLWELKNQSKAGFLPPPFNFNFRKQQKT